jgi:hypothetical protein
MLCVNGPTFAMAVRAVTTAWVVSSSPPSSFLQALVATMMPPTARSSDRE